MLVPLPCDAVVSWLAFVLLAQAVLVRVSIRGQVNFGTIGSERCLPPLYHTLLKICENQPINRSPDFFLILLYDRNFDLNFDDRKITSHTYLEKGRMPTAMPEKRKRGCYLSQKWLDGQEARWTS